MFAWSYEDMPGIDPLDIIHKPNVNPTYKLVIQKRRRFNPEWYTVISKEVGKLLKAKFIREAYYPKWLANVVMVKKANGNGGSILIIRTSINPAQRIPSRYQGLTSLWTQPSSTNY